MDKYVLKLYFYNLYMNDVDVVFGYPSMDLQLILLQNTNLWRFGTGKKNYIAIYFSYYIKGDLGAT